MGSLKVKLSFILKYGENDVTRMVADECPNAEVVKAEVWNYPSTFRPIYIRAMAGKSRKAAIYCFCTMCMGYTRVGVRECTAPYCPLYPYRDVRW